MNLTERIKKIFEEPPVDDSLCGLNKCEDVTDIISDEELDIDKYISMNISEDEYCNVPLENDALTDSFKNSEKELYRSMRTKSYTGPKHMKK